MINSLPHMFYKYSNDLCKTTKFRRFYYTNACIENDILYSFSLKRLSSKKYTLEFGVRPLCMDLFCAETGDFEIGGLTEEQNFETLEIDELWKFVTDEILPFFCSCENSQKAFHAVCEMIYRQNALRMDYLKRNGIKDCAWPIEKTTFFDDSVFYFAIKSLDYDSIIKSLSYKIPVSETKAESFHIEYKNRLAQGDIETAQVYEKKYISENKDCNYLKELLKHAIVNDSAFFEDVIRIREENSKKRLPPKLFV